MLIDALVITAVGVVALLLPSVSAYRSHLGRRLARQAETRVPAEQVTALETRLARRARGLGVGILVGGVALLALSFVWEGGDDSGGGFFLLSVMAVAGAAGLVTADILWPGELAEGPRTARANSPTLADYLPRWMRVLSWVVVGAGLLALATTLLLASSRWFSAETILRGPVPLLALGLPVLLLLTRWATRRILECPQPSRDETELYWQDAVRAQTLASLSVTTPFVSLLALIVCGSVLDNAASQVAVATGQVGPWWSTALLIAGYTIPFVLAIVALAVAASHASNGEMRQFRNRLWGGRPPQVKGAGA